MTPVVLAGIVTGAILRLALYFANRPLWVDEASLSLNIGVHGFGGLLQELDFGQGSPPLFLIAAKLSTIVFGMNERALRLPALLAGLLLLVTIPVIARRLGSERSVAAATWLVALSPLLLYYSNEVKQYAQEALVSALLILSSIPVIQGGSTTRQRLVLTLVGAMAIWASLPSAFVLCVIGGLLLLDTVTGRMRERWWFAATAVMWLVSVAVAYLTTFRAIARDPHMMVYWRSVFLPADLAGITERLPEVVGGLPSAVFLHRDLFQRVPEAVRIGAICVVLLLAGYGMIRSATERGWRLSLLLAGPIATAFVAFLLHQYPFTARVLCFAAPGLVLLVALGFGEFSARWSRSAVGLAGVLGLVPAAYHDVLDLRDPARAHINDQPVLAAVVARRLANEAVYMTSGGLQPWIYYTTNWDDPDRDRILRAAAIWRSRARLIADSGSPVAPMPELSYRKPPYNELYAAHSGLSVEFDPRPPRAVYASWGEDEARRIRAAADPCIWLFTRELDRLEFVALFPALRRAGGKEHDLVRRPGASARRMCFPTH